MYGKNSIVGIDRRRMVLYLTVLVFSLFCNIWQFARGFGRLGTEASTKKCPYTFHGGAGLIPDEITGCWCGRDKYCLCTPSLAIDTLLLGPDDSILLVERQDSGMHALPGGFVEWNERVEHAVLREVKEETNIACDINSIYLFGMYSDPQRDPRRHTASAVYVCRVGREQLRNAKSGDDAKAVVPHSLEAAAALTDLAFDHRQIIRDYLRLRR